MNGKSPAAINGIFSHFQHRQSKKKLSKGSAGDPPPASNLNVLEEELMSKINANVKLNEMVGSHRV